MPLELNPIISHAAIDTSQTVRIDDRTFYIGKLEGNDVVLAQTGIGIVNATQTSKTAFEHFGCSFAAAMFSGVAGSNLNIGDVAIPRRWSRDGGHTWTGVDPKMLTISRQLQGTTVPLTQNVPVGDAACLCPGVDGPVGVSLGRTPKVVVGGEGVSSDPYGGKAVRCLPGGGDMEGCAPCLLPSGSLQDAAAFAVNAPTLADPGFLGALTNQPSATSQADSQDEETAAVAQVASTYRVPFLGIRAVSDGGGDPLHLPGFPWQFFVYRQLAANNAAAVALAFLRLWSAPPPAPLPLPLPVLRQPSLHHAHRHHTSRRARRHKRHAPSRSHRTARRRAR